VTQWLGFPRYGDEGKVMGLAPYGAPRFTDELHRLVRPAGDLFELDLESFTHHEHPMELTWVDGSPSVGRLFSPKLEELRGPAREPDAELTSHHEDVAASLQGVLEEHELRLVAALWERTGLPRLCLAGGVALNAVANGRILRESPFEEVFVQPAASDSGTAIGAAFHVWNQPGSRWSTPTRRSSAPSSPSESPPATSSAGSRAGWSSARARSATARFSPTHAGTRSRTSSTRGSSTASRSARSRCRCSWSAHVDDTGRLQTVTRASNPRYHRLIRDFERRTGVPMVLNTSFDENEPIVMTPADAPETFRRTRIDLLVLGSLVVRRSGGSAQEAAEPAALGGQVEAER
jgi:predicted NodU family carbamoyl transferase